MVCIYCGFEKTQVKNSRSQKRSNTIWRRRRCEKCQNVFSTIESVELAQALRVELTGGKLIPFERDKLYLSIYKSLKHRNNPVNEATGLTNTTLSALLKSNKAVFSLEEIINTTKTVLKRFDNVASVQYDAFHKIN